MEIRHGTHMEKQFNDKDIYQKSYGSAVSSETYPSSILKHLEFT